MISVDDLLDELHRRPGAPRPEAIQLTADELRRLRLANDRLSRQARQTNHARQPGEPETLLGLRIEIVDHAPAGDRILPPVKR